MRFLLIKSFVCFLCHKKNELFTSIRFIFITALARLLLSFIIRIYVESD